MNVKQINTIVNSVVNQMNGTADVTSTDLTDVVQLGTELLQPANKSRLDNFLNTLVDRIGKTIISARSYPGVDPAIISDAFEFGAILQKIYVEPQEAEKSDVWGIEDGVTCDPFIIHKPAVKQWLFDGIDTWQVPITIPSEQVKSAFTSAEAMAAFIDGIFTTIENSIALHMESVANMAYANFIGEKLADGLGYTGGTSGTPDVHAAHNPGQVVNLLSEYKTLTGDSTLTAAKAMQNKDFLKYASQRINLTVKRLAKMSTMFNTTDYQRHTPREFVRCTMLSDFASACQFYLESDTYHNELVALPNYREVNYWQGSGKGYEYTDTSLVDITTASGKVVQQSGVVCLLNDVEAIALTHTNRTSESIYNPRNKTTNYFNNIDIGYMNDLTENGVVFLIADVVNTIYTKDYA